MARLRAVRLPFDFKETMQGLRHLSLGWQRRLLNKPANLYLSQFQTEHATKPLNESKKASICSTCGYALVEIKYDNGWLLKTCSAMPAVKPFDNSELTKWINSISES